MAVPAKECPPSPDGTMRPWVADNLQDVTLVGK